MDDKLHSVLQDWFGDLYHSSLKVPEDYFNNLSSDILKRISIDEALNPAFHSSFGIPRNYFEKTKYTSLLKAHEILKSSFSVPDRYFEESVKRIYQNISLTERFSGAEKAFILPDKNYFENSNRIINSQLSASISQISNTRSSGKTLLKIISMPYSPLLSFSKWAAFWLLLFGLAFVLNKMFYKTEKDTVNDKEFYCWLENHINTDDLTEVISSYEFNHPEHKNDSLFQDIDLNLLKDEI